MWKVKASKRLFGSLKIYQECQSRILEKCTLPLDGMFRMMAYDTIFQAHTALSMYISREILVLSALPCVSTLLLFVNNLSTHK